MADHALALCWNRLLSALPLSEPSQFHPPSIRSQQVNGQGLHEAGSRIEPAFCIEQSFALRVTVADTDGGVLPNAVAVLLVEDDELVRECLSERLTDRTKANAP